MKNIHDWVFHFNTYTNLWNAAKREDYNLLFSASVKSDKVLRSPKISVLEEIIEKTNGNEELISKLLKNNKRNLHTKRKQLSNKDIIEEGKYLINISY